MSFNGLAAEVLGRLSKGVASAAFTILDAVTYRGGAVNGNECSTHPG
jgi:hypothetical protein